MSTNVLRRRIIPFHSTDFFVFQLLPDLPHSQLQYFGPVTRKTCTSTKPTSPSRISKFLFSCTLTIAILTHPSSLIIALTSSQGVLIVSLTQDGAVGPSYPAHCTLTVTEWPCTYLLKRSNGHHIGCLTMSNSAVIKSEITLMD